MLLGQPTIRCYCHHCWDAPSWLLDRFGLCKFHSWGCDDSFKNHHWRPQIISWGRNIEPLQWRPRRDHSATDRTLGPRRGWTGWIKGNQGRRWRGWNGRRRWRGWNGQGRWTGWIKGNEGRRWRGWNGRKRWTGWTKGNEGRRWRGWNGRRRRRGWNGRRRGKPAL